MTTSVFDSALYGALFSDEALSACLGDAAFVKRMVEVEAAYAKACASVGLVDAKIASQLSEKLHKTSIL